MQLLVRYLNDPEVQKAIHAPTIKWVSCNGVTLDYSRQDLLSSMLPVYRRIFGKIRILVYSGDVDGMVPNTGTCSALYLNSMHSCAVRLEFFFQGLGCGWISST